ncbi:M16 family metallopeptidase [Phenylobacterium montanum]|uniref:Insulinase family protein n=1 Tax=Phenylobacterium montanum TaxID=2823693 RepID=A0A975IWA4_9CAUL|nr:pitrilysin family protein [Caulobacter sp. S6]QUD88186.1 insulinase family protein [Caulobacter sp. S6]
MKRFLATAGCAAALSLASLGLASAAPPPALAPLPSADIAYSKFVLANGLTLIVHEDHKAPIVAVNIWYHTGSKNEPPGRTGFAHLFEHLMFGGSANYPQVWFKAMERVGGTDINGTTYYDRTNFFETVPTAALDMTLWLESDRMGHLLDKFDEKVLTTQRGVVENEKRQDENQPYAISDDVITRSVWPAGHPYSHTVIGEMQDLDAAAVKDVKDWFSKYYGPTNAVIVLAGDITPEEAKAKVEKYFGEIPPGPPVVHQKVWIAKRTGSQVASVRDRVPLARLYKIWNTPEVGSADDDYLVLLSDVLVGDKTSRLYKRMVYADQTATDVSATVDEREIASLFDVEMTAKPGVSLETLDKAFREELARLLRDGPTAEEVERVKTARVSGIIQGLQRVGGFGGKSDLLASGYTLEGSPDAFKTRLARIEAATPADLKAAGQRWLSDGDFTLQVTPFPDYQASDKPADRSALPAPAAIKAPKFVKFERATLSNGLKLIVAERHDNPSISLHLVADAGYASDQGGKAGAAGLTMRLMPDGTDRLDALQISARLSELGASLSASAGRDTSEIDLSALSARLDPALDLFADVLLRPAFREADIEREKALQIAQIQQDKDDPVQMTLRVLPPLVYGPGHAYAAPLDGLGDEASVTALTREDLVRDYQTWLRPNAATLIVVGDTTLAEIRPKLEARLAAWKPAPVPAKNIAPVSPPAEPRVFLMDKPGALQSVILAAIPAPPRNDPDHQAIKVMNTALGGAFNSRLNMNLREDKHWAYGAGSFDVDARGPGLFIAYAPVETDKTAESFAEVRRELAGIVGERPVTQAETDFAHASMVNALAGEWETNAAVAGSLDAIATYGLADDYFDTLPARIEAITPADAEKAAKRVVQPDRMTWIIAGDRKAIEPGLKALGLKVQVLDADGKPIP